MDTDEEKLLDKEQWKAEAKAVIEDIQPHIQEASVSERLQGTADFIFINVKTIEGNLFCVKMSKAGFQIVGYEYNSSTAKGDGVVYETPYALLDQVSPKYRKSFASQLTKRLESLQKELE